MRPLDRLVGAGMWVCVAATVPVIVGVISTGVYRIDWRYTVGLCLFWLPPALALGQVEDTRGRQPLLFYGFASATFAWAFGLLLYGLFFYDGIQ